MWRGRPPGGAQTGTPATATSRGGGRGAEESQRERRVRPWTGEEGTSVMLCDINYNIHNSGWRRKRNSGRREKSRRRRKKLSRSKKKRRG